ncbi:MAG: hypothetical protein LBC82_02280 [Oscillospiraceae bacterium]|jgi:hypothetical protein|nr:hypothetical protein [Oscillospiraceae bacterium]
MIKQNKKIIASILTILLIAVIGSLIVIKALDDDYVYVNPADKIVLSDNEFITRVTPPSLNSNLLFSDLVIDGTIIDMSVHTGYMMDGILTEEEIMEAWGFVPMATSTHFTVKVNEVFRGELEKDEYIITFGLGGCPEGMFTKPNVGDNAILFLSSSEFGTYNTATGEHSIFTYDEKDRLYSFSNTEELSAFDGRNKSTLRRTVRSSKIFNRNVDISEIS